MTKRLCILLVEDEALVRAVMAADLEDFGFAVVEAEDGAEAVALVEGGTPVDLLVTDIRLPGPLDGWAVAERVRALRPGLPVIYATGYSGAPPRPVDGSRILHKPFRTEALRDAVQSVAL